MNRGGPARKVPGTVGRLPGGVWVAAGLLVLSLAWTAAIPEEEGGVAITGRAVAADGTVFGASMDGTYDSFRDPPCGRAPSNYSIGGRISY